MGNTERAFAEVEPRAGAEVRPQEEARGTCLTPPECAAILLNVALAAETRSMVALAIHTGMRLGEMLALRLADCDAERGVLTIRYGGPPELPTKSGAVRRVALSVEQWATFAMWAGALLHYDCPKNPRGLVYPGKAGGFQWGPPREWKRALSAAGITRRVRWQDLRHTAATAMLFGWWGPKRTVKEVQRIMGHADVETTERYLHDLDERVRPYCR